MPAAPARDPVSDEPAEDEAMPTNEEVVAKTRPTDVLRLQREYVRKLRTLIKRFYDAAAVQQKPMFGRPGAPTDGELLSSLRHAADLWNLWNKLRPAATDLARYASGLIEGVRLDKLTVIELRMRNAELEAAIENAAEAAKLPARNRPA